MKEKIALIVVSILLIATSICLMLASKDIYNMNSVIEEQRDTISDGKIIIQSLETSLDDEKNKHFVEYDTLGWDFEYVCRVVTAECGAEPYEGKVAVAQCVRDLAKYYHMNPEQIVKRPNTFASPADASLVTDEIRQVCEDVLIFGKSAIDKPIHVFYSTRGGFTSDWHEKQNHVLTVGDHKFFNFEEA